MWFTIEPQTTFISVCRCHVLSCVSFILLGSVLLIPMDDSNESSEWGQIGPNICRRGKMKNNLNGSVQTKDDKVLRESSNGAKRRRCLPDGRCLNVFEWQGWNIDQTSDHKHVAWLLTGKRRRHFNSVSASLFFFTTDFLFLISSLFIPRVRNCTLNHQKYSQIFCTRVNSCSL